MGQAIIGRRSRAPIAEFRSHDLRRTVATEMAKLGLPLDLVATVLGQEAGGGETRILRKHYIHDQFVDRKADALAQWDRRLRAILAGEAGKVVAAAGQVMTQQTVQFAGATSQRRAGASLARSGTRDLLIVRENENLQI